MEELMKRMKGSAQICIRHGQQAVTMEGYLYVQEKCECFLVLQCYICSLLLVTTDNNLNSSLSVHKCAGNINTLIMKVGSWTRDMNPFEAELFVR